MKESLVSVVMITYGHEQYIAQAIEGVLMQQTNFEVELIIADDCSPDDTQNVVENIIKTHSKSHWVKHTRHQHNKGMNDNFLWAMKQAKGKYIALCEGDDYWTDPLKLQKQVDFLEENLEYSFVSGNTNIIRDGIIVSHLLNYTEIRFEAMLATNILGINTCTLLFRSSALTDRYYQFSSKVKFGDWILYLFLLKFGQGFYLSDVLGCYRVHNTGMWSSMSEIDRVYNLLEMHNHFEEVFPEYLTQIKKNKLKELVNFQNIILNNYNKTRKVFDFELFLTKIKYRIRKVIKA